MILCCGEALIDMIPDTSVNGDACLVPKAGGALFNTSIALGRLGADVGLFTGVSNDLFGALLEKELLASGVNTAFLSKSNAPSTLAFVELNDGHAEYTFYSENTADTSLTASDIPTNVNGVDALLFGGISLCTDPTASTMLTMMKKYAGSHVIMLDPNIRTAFIKDEVKYRNHLAEMIALTDILKISDEDLNWLAPEATSTEMQIKVLIGDSPKLVLVTKGSKGAIAFLGTTEIASVAAQKVVVADSIGAGDTFNAGILHSLVNNRSLTKPFLARPDQNTIQTALVDASNVAAITVSRIGANPPWLSEIQTWTHSEI
jgi:fructokinase